MKKLSILCIALLSVFAISAQSNPSDTCLSAYLWMPENHAPDTVRISSAPLPVLYSGCETKNDLLFVQDTSTYILVYELVCDEQRSLVVARFQRDSLVEVVEVQTTTSFIGACIGQDGKIACMTHDTLFEFSGTSLSTVVSAHAFALPGNNNQQGKIISVGGDYMFAYTDDGTDALLYGRITGGMLEWLDSLPDVEFMPGGLALGVGSDDSRVRLACFPDVLDSIRIGSNGYAIWAMPPSGVYDNRYATLRFQNGHTKPVVMQAENVIYTISQPTFVHYDECGYLYGGTYPESNINPNNAQYYPMIGRASGFYDIVSGFSSYPEYKQEITKAFSPIELSSGRALCVLFQDTVPYTNQQQVRVMTTNESAYVVSTSSDSVVGVSRNTICTLPSFAAFTFTGEDSIPSICFTEYRLPTETPSQVGLDELHMSIRIYPNPCSDILKVEAKQSLPVEIWDIFGTCVAKGVTGENIQISALSVGTYIVSLGQYKKRIFKN